MATTIETSRTVVNNVATPVKIVTARVGRTGLKIFVQGPLNSFITIGKDNTVTTSTGYPIGLGEYKFDPVTEGDVYALGTGMTVTVLEVH